MDFVAKRACTLTEALEPEILKRLIRRLDRDTFRQMIDACLKSEYGDSVTWLPQLGRDIWHNRIGYLRRNYNPSGNADGFYLIHHMPSELFKDPLALDFRQPELLRALQAIKTSGAIETVEYHPDLTEFLVLFFMTNLAGASDQNYLERLAQKYEQLVNALGFDSPDVFVGTSDTYVDQRPAQTAKALSALLHACDATSIRLVPGQVSVEPFCSERFLSHGVTPSTKSPCAPVFVPRLGLPTAVQELQALLQQNPTEAVLHKFISRYYPELFGSHYTHIQTEVWLRFPQLDIAGKNRRIDIFLRNDLTRDWDILEIKRFLPLTGTYRDGPMLSRAIVGGIRQIKNYQHLLEQDEVKRKLAQDGIKYCKPECRLVIGKSPDIEWRQWRELVAHNPDNVKITTYDDLLRDMRIRLMDRSSWGGVTT